MRAILVLIIALALGGVAILFASKMMGSKPVAQAKPVTTQVVVATVDQPAGAGFKLASLKTTDWPANKFPVGAFKSVEQLKGRILKSNVASGAVILESMLAPVGAIGGMSALVTPGMRAMTIRVNDVVGVAGFTLAGNYVDVVSHMNLEKNTTDKRNISMSKIVLENVLVLAVAQQTGHEDTTPKIVDSVTLQVTPQQAEILDMARNVGKLALVLRNQSDDQAADTAGMTNLVLMRPRSAPTHAAAKSNCSQVINGMQVGKECF